MGHTFSERWCLTMANKSTEQIVLSKRRKRFYQKCVAKADKMILNKEKVSNVIKKARKIFERLHNLPKCAELSEHICDFCDLLSDYFDGVYQNLPLSTIVALLAGLLYLVLPFDVIADFLPAIGWIDDAAILSFVILAEQNDVKEYLAWKENRVLADSSIIDLDDIVAE